ncbi:hypothetical protein [Heyndrickxia vini]|nr:hypothetical protein [Heyndrickxia vini]
MLVYENGLILLIENISFILAKKSIELYKKSKHSYIMKMISETK